MRAYLRSCPCLYRVFNKFPIFPILHKCQISKVIPLMKRSCSYFVHRPPTCCSDYYFNEDYAYMQEINIIQYISRLNSKLSNPHKYYNYNITRMSLAKLVLVFAVIIVVLTDIPHFNKKQIIQKIDNTKINYGSTIRIKASAFPFYLHSHNVNYPRGSGQQSVTGFSMDDDYNSLWTIKQSHRENVKTYYHELKCGDALRLEHALTKRNLHSEQLYQSMVTLGQQVSAFGQGGDGDDNDNWVLDCKSKSPGQPFYGGDFFELSHENTGKKLKMSRYFEYNFGNWENCPFQGQIEVSATDKSTRETEFKIVGGVFFKDKQGRKSQKSQNQDL